MLMLVDISFGKQVPSMGITDIFTSIFNQRFDEAERLLASENNKIGVLYVDILTIEKCWWKYISSNKREDLKQLSALLEKYRNQESHSEQDKIIRLIGYTYSLRFESMQKNYFRANVFWYKARKLLKECNFSTPAFSRDEIRLVDLYDALFSYFNSRFYGFLIQNEETPDSIIEKMESFCADENIIVSSLSHYFLGKIYLEMEKEQAKAKTHFNILTEHFPNNNIFRSLQKSCS